jgi:hypothetical protein
VLESILNKSCWKLHGDWYVGRCTILDVVYVLRKADLSILSVSRWEVQPKIVFRARRLHESTPRLSHKLTRFTHTGRLRWLTFGRATIFNFANTGNSSNDAMLYKHFVRHYSAAILIQPRLRSVTCNGLSTQTPPIRAPCTAVGYKY